MGNYYDEIPKDPKLIEWILNQKLFHVASAPLKGGHVNVSPKGYQTFKLVNSKACWYLDLSGSGNETISHIYEPGNARVTILFQAFDSPARLLRIYGKGKVFERGSPEYENLMNPARISSADDQYDWPTPESRPGARAIIWIDIMRIGTSCGFSVPLMEYVADRDTLDKWCSKLEDGDARAEDPYSLDSEKGFLSWMHTWNTWSLDGLPGLKSCVRPASPEKINKTMRLAGLTTQAQTSQGNSQHSVWLLLVGLILGVLCSHFMRDATQLSLSPLVNRYFASR